MAGMWPRRAEPRKEDFMRRKQMRIVTEADDLFSTAPEPEWLFPELKTALREVAPADDLGFRRLAEVPWASRPKRGAVVRPLRRAAQGIDPDWPDAA
jgi:hypothetical protein